MLTRQSVNNSPLYFPTNLSVFPNVFLKMEFIGRTLEERRNGVSSTIYLPLPENEFFQRQFQLNYSTDDLGLSGEFAKRNIDSILDSIKKTVGSRDIDDAFSQLTSSVYNDIISTTGFGGAVKTALERQMMGGDSITSRAAAQSLGYSAAPNSTQVFDGMSIRDTVTLTWNLSPKNYEDGKAIEKIYKEILKLSLPYLKEEHLTKTYNKYGPSYLEMPDFLTTEQNPTTVPTRLEAGDVFSTESGMLEKVTEAQQYYSTTFELPYQLHLKVMKMNSPNLDSRERGFLENTEIVEAEELITFKVPFVVTVFDMEFNKLNDDSEATFIEFNGEYFSQKYMIYMALREERMVRNWGDDHPGTDIIDHSKNIKGKDYVKR